MKKFKEKDTSALSRMIYADLNIDRDLVLTGAIIQEFILKFPTHLMLYGITMKEDGVISGKYGDFYSITSWNLEEINKWIKTQRARRIDFDTFLQRNIEPLLPLPQDPTEQLDRATIISPEDQIKLELVKEFLSSKDLNLIFVCGKEIELARDLLEFIYKNKLSGKTQRDKYEEIVDIFGSSSSTVRRFLVDKEDCKEALSNLLTSLLNKARTEILSTRSTSYIAGNSSCEAVSVAEAKVEIEETDTKKELLFKQPHLEIEVVSIKRESKSSLEDAARKIRTPYASSILHSPESGTLVSPTSIVSLPLLSPRSSEKEKMDFWHKVIQLAMQSTGDSVEQIQKDFNDSFFNFSEEKDPLENMYKVTSDESFLSPIKSQEK